MRKVLVIAALAALVVSVAAFAQKADSPISQGDFAALLASNLNRPAPGGGWNGTNAPPYLASLGLTPLAGAWSSTATLKEGDLAHILRLLGQNFYSTQPESPVTWAKANSVLAGLRDFFKTYNPVAKAANQTTTTKINTALGGADAGAPTPASPSTP
jgi:hypothetical protein